MSTPVLGGALEGTRGELIVYFASHALDGPAGTDRHMAEALGVYGYAPSGDLGVDSIAPPCEERRA
jgi:hypothetical protein